MVTALILMLLVKASLSSQKHTSGYVLDESLLKDIEDTRNSENDEDRFIKWEGFFENWKFLMSYHY